MDESYTRPPLRLVGPPPNPSSYSVGSNRPDPDGPSPLEIVVAAAQAAWRKAVQPDGTINLDMAERAAFIAEKALPYVSPKLATVTVKTGQEETRGNFKADSDEVRRKIDRLISRQSERA